MGNQFPSTPTHPANAGRSRSSLTPNLCGASRGRNEALYERKQYARGCRHRRHRRASDIAAIVGISPFADRWQIWARKQGLIAPEESERMFWGIKLQSVIAQVFAEKMDLPVEWHDRRIYHPTRSWQYASPDAFTSPSRASCWK
jgi:hypothetical protein